ncbi:hypothetical protein CONLIGDRAFT_694314 [Coniochaeta ligniaria NRRL 30616]|uniref:Uncharacterized protein n=1 Tax=Coniochaeta ligniaria NRRL 30616 TaxID=1408157 RepID=A0A1J7IZC4_9PEZI|nr:hypothetical protein CONLIGDRAFT_694314 [Coniochaeta ligniaria NRRL 30616]
MEFEGSVLCHIINLFSVTLDPEPWARQWPEELSDRRRERHCEFPFGKLAWTAAGDQLHAHFTPGLESELASAKQPFGFNGTLMEPGTIMASYLTALLHGVSDSEYRLAPPTAPLPERISRLTTCFDLLTSRDGRNEPLLISYDWFEEAARIKRRVLAQGGKDHSFFQDICTNIDTSTDPYFISQETEREFMKKRVRQLFLLDDETFTFSVPGGQVMSVPASLGTVTPRSICKTVLLGYEHHPAGSWKRSLFDMEADVVKILEIPNNLTIRKQFRIQLIEFTSWCDLWNKKVFLGAPI